MFYPSVSINQFRVSPTKGDHADPVYSGRKVKTGCAMEAMSKAAAVDPTNAEIFASFTFHSDSDLRYEEDMQTQKVKAQKECKKAARWANNSAEFRDNHIHRCLDILASNVESIPEFSDRDDIQKLQRTEQGKFEKASQCQASRCEGKSLLGVTGYRGFCGIFTPR